MVNAHRAEEADVYIEDGVVVAVRPNIPVSARRASARLLRSQCSTWFEDGSHLQPWHVHGCQVPRCLGIPDSLFFYDGRINCL